MRLLTAVSMMLFANTFRTWLCERLPALQAAFVEDMQKFNIELIS